MSKLLLILRCALLCAAILSSAQSNAQQSGLSSEGREFWLGFMPNYIVPASNLTLQISSRTVNQVLVEMFGGDGAIVATRTMNFKTSSSQQIRVPVSIAQTLELETAVYRAVRITSVSPCRVSAFSESPNTSGSFLALPIHALGTEYYCFSYPDDAYAPGSDNLSGGLLIVAPYNNTTVTITTSATTKKSQDGKSIGHPLGATWSVKLMRGQTYLVQSTGLAYGVEDLTGSRVTSDKPISFISGHQRVSVPLIPSEIKDHIVEMIPPTRLWGTEYIGIPELNRSKVGSGYRILSSENGNTISIQSDTDTTITLNAGEFAEISFKKAPMVFSSTSAKRFLVMQYAYSQDPFSHATDAFMTTLIPTSAFSEQTGVRPLPNNSNGNGSTLNNYAAFVSTVAGIDSIMLRTSGGAIVPLASSGYTKVAVPGSVYAGGTLRTNDSMTFATSSAPFGAFAYGVASAEGRGHPLAFTFRPAGDFITPKVKIIDHDSCRNVAFQITDQGGLVDIFPVTAEFASVTSSPRHTENYIVSLAPGFEVGAKSATVTARVIDGSEDAMYAIRILDAGGNDTLITGSYKAQKISWSLDAPFALTRLGDTLCRTITLRNLDTDSISVNPRPMLAQSGYKLSPIRLYRLGPNDSVKLDLCFIPKDTLTYSDSVSVVTNCYTTGFIATARSAQAKIFAEDDDLGTVRPGDVACADILIKNISEVPITILGYEQTGDTSFYVLSPNFPVSLGPGEQLTATICFNAPAEVDDFEARIEWTLDRPTFLNKTFSLIAARVRQSSVPERIEASLRLWPNPAMDHFNVDVPEGIVVTSIAAIDVLGASHRLSMTGLSGRIRADIEVLPSGSYTIVVDTDQGQITRQLVINR